MQFPFRLLRSLCACLAAGAALVVAAEPLDTGHRGKEVKTPALYVVGYSHLDTQWCWSYPQVIREFIPNTLHENFALFEKYPNYVFNWTGSNRYRFMKEYYPTDYARLKKYVAEGRWFPAGSSIEEGDVNSPSEESLIRQVMYGNEFFRREFGIASSEYMLPDCFGFPASLPSILAHCGLNGFSTQKLTWGSAVGIPFNVGSWVGPDGRSVIAALNPGAYDSPVREDLSSSTRWIDRLSHDKQKYGLDVDYMYYGVGDRGGAPDDRSVMYVEKSLQRQGPVHIAAGRADQMFNDLSAADVAVLPEYRGDLELTQHSAGSLSSEGAMKRWNRKNELLADSAERASVAADWVGALPYDRSRITDAWLRFLPGQFHDLMAGTALPIAYNYTWNDEVIAMNESADVLKGAVGGVAHEMDTSGAGIPLIVYNPLSIRRNGIAEATVQIVGEAKGIKVVGPGGVEVPSQVIGRIGDQVRFIFLANVPSIGFACYHVKPAPPAKRESALKVTRKTLENGRYRVELNDAGDVKSIYDKKAAREMLSAPARLAFQFERPQNYPAWNMDWNDQRKAPRGFVDGAADFKIVENGPVRVAIQVTRTAEGSKFIQTVRLSAGEAEKRVEFSTKVDWESKECALKAVFPFTVSNPLATYNWELGTVQRGNDDPKKYEVPSHKWSDLTDRSGGYGVSILDDCKYGSDKPSDDTMRLTLIYTPGTRGDYQHQGTQDWGKNEVLYALLGHQGKWSDGDTQWQAWSLNQPLAVFQTRPHEGELGRKWSLAQSNTPQIQIEAMKKAEDSDEIVVRTNELAGRSAHDVRLSFAAPLVSAREVDGQERPLGPATIGNGALVFSATPYRPYAFAVRLGRPKSSAIPPSSRPLNLPFNIKVTSLRSIKSVSRFDAQGDTIPQELLPQSVVSDGVRFKFAAGAGAGKDAVACLGQTLKLPRGKNRRIYFVAASSDCDRNAEFTVGKAKSKLRIQAWDGFIGQWDSRLWQGKVPELTYTWDNALDGLVPGFIKRVPVAWYADHIRSRDGMDKPYSFCYLFRYSLNVPDGATTVKLPRDERIKIMAASLANNQNDETIPVSTLYDTVDHSQNSSPTIIPAAGRFTDATLVSIGHSFYWGPRWKLRYTTDGTKPTTNSPVYVRPFYVEKSVTINAAQFQESGKSSPVATAKLEVNDRNPPEVRSVTAMSTSSEIKVEFNKPVEITSATDVAHYRVSSPVNVNAVTIDEDGKAAVLRLDGNVPSENASVTVSGVKDQSASANVMHEVEVPITIYKPVFNLPGIRDLDGKGGGEFSQEVGALPTGALATWTINMWTYMSHVPNELTILGGFGSANDDTGAERFLIKFHGGIHFWGSGVDIDAGTPFALNKWQMVTLTYENGTLTIYLNGHEIKSAPARLMDAERRVQLGTTGPWGDSSNRFEGRIANFSIWKDALSPSNVLSLAARAP